MPILPAIINRPFNPMGGDMKFEENKHLHWIREDVPEKPARKQPKWPEQEVYYEPFMAIEQRHCA